VGRQKYGQTNFLEKYDHKAKKKRKKIHNSPPAGKNVCIFFPLYMCKNKIANNQGLMLQKKNPTYLCLKRSPPPYKKCTWGKNTTGERGGGYAA